MKLKKTGRIKLLKKISYYTELSEWKGIKKLYAHIIRQTENGLSAWSQDFSGVETPLLIKYVKTDKARKPFYVNDDKKVTQRDDTVFYCSHYQRRKCSQNSSHNGKIKAVERYLQHIFATCCITIYPDHW